MPKKLLSVGMGGVFFSQVGEQIFGLLAGDLKPEGIGAKIQLARPRQDAALLADGRIAEELVVSPRRKNAFPYLSGKIHFAFGAVFETKPDTIAVEDFRSNNLYHAQNNTMSLHRSGAQTGNLGNLGTSTSFTKFRGSEIRKTAWTSPSFRKNMDTHKKFRERSVSTFSVLAVGAQGCSIWTVSHAFAV